MSKLLVKPQAPDAEGRIHEVTPETAGWEHVGFAVHKLAAGEKIKSVDQQPATQATSK